MRNKGSILISIILIMSSLMMFGVAISSAVLATTIKTQRAYQGAEALSLAEAGINKALWELNQGNNYNGETDNTSLSGSIQKGSFDVTISTQSQGVYEIESTGYVPSKNNFKQKRTVRVKLTDKESSSKAAFFYGVQLGSLGAMIENNAYIDGNVYSGGSITGKNGSYVKGSVIVYNTGSNLGTIQGLELKDPTNINPPFIYSAWAHNIFNSTIYGDAKYSCNTTTCFSGNTVKGIKYPNSPDTDPILPSDWSIQDSDINIWKTEAEGGGTISSFSGTSIGNKKINGNMTITGTTTLTGIVWVTGNLEITGGSTLKLDPSYGPNSGMIVVDGQIHLGNGAIILGSGDPKSSIMLLSTKVNNTLTDPVPAILADNGSAGAVYYAKDGILKLNNTAYAKSFAGKGLFISQNAYFKFDKGIKNPNFNTGPGGRWTITDWRVIY